MEYDKLFEDKEYRKRLGNLTQSLDHVDQAIIFNRADLFYYSGMGLDGIIHLDGNITRYVSRNVSAAEKLSYLDIKPMGSFRLFKELAKEKTADTMGLELDILPYKTVEYIKKSFNTNIVDISPQLRTIRSIKSAKEQQYMKLAARQTDESFEYIKDKIKPGVTEIELSVEVESYLRREGHPGFVQIRNFQQNYTTSAYVMAGKNTASLNSKFGPVSGTGVNRYHMGGPSHKKIKDNEAVLIDTTGIVEGYTADETITFFLGSPDKKLTDAYEVAKQIQESAVNWLKSGEMANEAYDKMQEFVREAGFTDSFMGTADDKVAFIGHGIGLELDEFPIITPGYKQQLIEGQIIALEPKFILAGSGVGLEQDYIVRQGKAERITKYSWD